MKSPYAALLIAALAQPILSFAQGPMGGQALVSPEIAADHHVTFRLRAPQANEVSVSGLPAPLPMTKDAQGVWSATTASPLEPDVYAYGFVVDGVRMPDPSNMLSSPVGILGANSYLRIPGVAWSDSNGPHGAVARHVYQSSIIGGPEAYYVYTPPTYDAKRKAPYPVLVTLHGLGDSAQDWFVQGGADLTLDNLISSGKAVPMILVSPTAYGTAQGQRGAAGGFPSFTKALIEEILPQVEKQYNASNKPSERAITGLSMGAAQSLLLLNRLDVFEWIGSFSPGFDMYNPQRAGGGPATGGQQGGRGAQPAPGSGAGGGAPAAQAGRGPQQGQGPGAGGQANAPQAGGQQTPGAGGRGTGTINQRQLLPDGVLDATFPKLDTSANAHIKLLYLTCGTADDHLNLTRQFKAFLEAKKVKITSCSEPEGIRHVWPFWRAQLAAFAPMLFK